MEIVLYLFQELASARDELLRKIKVTEQEQEELYTFLGIMGEQETASNSPRQPGNPSLPSLLDWDLAPDLSFGSVRSSVDTKSLSGSLDPHSFCSSQDCLNVKMKYEHLIEKIQQFLKIRSLETSVLEQSAAHSDDSKERSKRKEPTGDRFVESTEPESQMLQRLTSIHLEHFVRLPKNDTNAADQINDQFVLENLHSNDSNEPQSVEDSIVDMIIKASNGNTEGHFSQNETDSEEDELDGKRTHIVGDRSLKAKRVLSAKGRERSVSICVDDGHFSEEEDDLNEAVGRRRHFSDSDLVQGIDNDHTVAKTSQSDNREGQFVLEQSDVDRDHPTFEEVGDIEEKEVYSNLKADSYGVSESKSNNPAINSNRSNIDSHFIVDEKPPGSGGMTIHTDHPPKTGEETGDFFEENVPAIGRIRRKSADRSRTKSMVGNVSQGSCNILEKTVPDKLDKETSNVKGHGYTEDRISKKAKTVVLSEPIVPKVSPVRKPSWRGHRRNFSEGDVVVRKLSLQRDFGESESVLEADLSAKDAKFDKGQRSYENAVFDILNSICPGTDPHRRLGVTKPTDTFQPVVEAATATPKEFSDLPKDEDLRHKFEQLNRSFEELSKENDNLKAEQTQKKGKRSGTKKDTKDALQALEKDNKALREKYDKVERENEKVKSDIRKIEHKHSEMVKKYASVDLKRYDELKVENVKLQGEVTSLNEDMKFVTEEVKLKVVEFDKLQQILKSTESGKETLDQKVKEMECKRLEVEMQLREESKETNNLKEEVAFCGEEIGQLNETNANLQLALSKLSTENDNLKALEKKQAQLVEEQSDLKFQINNLQTERNELLKIIDEDKGRVLEEKEELEKALLAHDDINRQLENKVDELNAENSSLNELLKNERQLKLDIRESEENLKVEKYQLKQKVFDLENEKKKMLEENKGNLNNIADLKREKQQLNEMIKQLQIDNNTVRDDLSTKASEVNDVTQVNKELNEQIGKLVRQVGDLEPQVTSLRKEVQNLTYANKQLTVPKLSIEEKPADALKLELLEMHQEKREPLAGAEMPKIKHKVESFDQSTETRDLEEEFFTNRDKLPKHESIDTDDTGSSYTVSMDTVDIYDGEDMMSLKEELEMLKTENVALKERIDSIDARSDSDTDMQILQDMRDAIKTLNTEKVAIERQKSEVSDTLEKDQKRLQGEMEELLAENDALRRNMKMKEDNLRKENTEILKMYNDLRNEVEVLVISKHELEVEIHALKDVLEQEAGIVHDKTVEHDTSKELTLQDLEEMNDLKMSIEKLKSDLKEKDSYTRKLEEHLLGSDRGVPKFASTPKPVLSKGNPLLSKAVHRRTSFTGLSRQAFSHDVSLDPRHEEREVIGATQSEIDEELARPVDRAMIVEELESSLGSEKRFVEGISAPARGRSSSLMSSFGRSLNTSHGLDVSERIRSGLRADEDGHLALELKQFELVSEITKLRRDLRETKAVYAQETTLLTDALELEKIAKDVRSRAGSFGDYSLSSNISHDLLVLRKEIAVVKEDNRLLRLDNDRWLERLKEQEDIVLNLKERLNKNTSGYGEIEEVFGRQLALLQKQREELVNKLKDKEYQISTLSLDIGEKGIIEESLRKDKNILMAKLDDRERLEKDLQEKKLKLEKQSIRQRELEDVIYRKDLNEIELMKQKRLLEEELKDIESKFKDKEETLDYEKHRLLDELRDKHNQSRSQLSDSNDDVSSACSESAVYSDRNIGRLEVMLEEVERQHCRAVNVLKDQLRTKYSRREKDLRKEHRTGLAKLNQDANRQVN